MFDDVSVKPKTADKINPVAQIKHLVSGGEHMSISTKVMRGSKGSGNAYLIGEIKGVEVFRLECGNIKADWTSIAECNLFVYALMEQITAGFVSYIEENRERAEAEKASERAKRQDHVSAVKVELSNAKTPAEYRKILRNHGLHPAKFDALANKLEVLQNASEDHFAEYIGGDI